MTDRCEQCEREKYLRDVMGIRPSWPLIPHEHFTPDDGALPLFADPEE
jgi:hypothetical protein